jgi:hypothetical protein
MSGLFSRESLNFLYRNDQGEVSRAVWWSGLVPLASLLLVLTIIWLLVAPWGQRGLNERAFIDVRTIVSYAYLLFYTLAVILIAVSYTNLSAKRFRARGRIGGFAGLLPLAALLAGAAHWLYPRVPESMPYWSLVAADLTLVGVVLWHVFDLGLSPDK